MLKLINVFWNICRLKAGPQDLTITRNILISTVLIGIIVDSKANAVFLPELSGIEVINAVAIYNVFLLIGAYFLLKLIGKEQRGMQTITALAGSGLLISLVLLPGLLFLDASEKPFISFSYFILFDNVWRIIVSAHIFRYALSISFMMGMIISVSYLLFGLQVANFLLPI